jgi:hypothetical protein
LALSACQPRPLDPAAERERLILAGEQGEPVDLTIYGLNYTDTEILSFVVGASGGGDVAVSRGEFGGGGYVCCIEWRPGWPLPITYDLLWTRDGKRYCKREAQLLGPVPANPNYFAVHFFPDGHIELEITERRPNTKLKLRRFNDYQRKPTGNTVADEQTAECRDGVW